MPQILLTGTDTGIWKSQDYGVSWNQVYAGSSVSSISVGENGTMYAMVYDISNAFSPSYCFIIKSVDYGDSWVFYNDFLTVTGLGGIPVNAFPDIFHVGGNNFILIVISGDRDVYQFSATTPFPVIFQFNFLPFPVPNSGDPLTRLTIPGYTFVGSQDVLYRSSDGGYSWTDVSVGLNLLIFRVVSLGIPGVLIATGEDQINSNRIIWKSTDNGDSWVQTFIDFSSIVHIHGMLYLDTGRLLGIDQNGDALISDGQGELGTWNYGVSFGLLNDGRAATTVPGYAHLSVNTGNGMVRSPDSFVSVSSVVSTGHSYTVQSIIQPLAPFFIATPDEGVYPLSVSFTDGSGPVGSIVSWFWDFGDGYTSTAQNPSHIFTSPRNYEVTLTVFSYVDSASYSSVISAYDPTKERLIIYVDSMYGYEANLGEVDSPVETLQRAYQMVKDGGLIVLQNGDGSSYGDLVITKNVMIQAAYGAFPTVGNFSVVAADCAFEGLTFDTQVICVNINQNIKGAVRIRECTFKNSTTDINIVNTNYVSITRCTFRKYDYGVKVLSAREVVLASNLFYEGGKRAIDVESAIRVDLFRNTIFGAIPIGGTAINPDLNLRVVYITLSSLDIANRRVQLPSFAYPNTFLNGVGYTGYDIAMNVVNGPSFLYGTDYVGDGGGSLVDWGGYQLQNYFKAGDIVRVMYAEGQSLGGGEAVRLFNIVDPNSVVDSNNIGAVC